MAFDREDLVVAVCELVRLRPDGRAVLTERDRPRATHNHREISEAMIAGYLRDRDELVELWFLLSIDQRCSSGPYVIDVPSGWSVGWHGARDTGWSETFHEKAPAVASFIRNWVFDVGRPGQAE